MIRNLFPVLFLFFGYFLFGQSSRDTTIYTSVDIMPFFPGCDDISNDIEKRKCSEKSMAIYLSNNLNYPQVAGDERVEGIVIISFVVEKSGRVSHPEIVRDIGGGCGEAAFEVISRMPDWESGKLQGKPVRVKLSQPISFFVRDNAHAHSNKHTIFWGDLNEQTVSKNDLYKNIEKKLILRDRFGEKIRIEQLSFTISKKRKEKSATSRGEITSDLKKLIKKVKPGDTFIITTTFQENGSFYFTKRAFYVVD